MHFRTESTVCKQLFTVLFTSKSSRPLVSNPLSDFEEILFSFTGMSIWQVWEIREGSGMEEIVKGSGRKSMCRGEGWEEMAEM